MHALAEIVKSVVKDGDTWLVVRLPKSRLKEEIENKTITNTEMRFDDGRHISNLQRKKAYATIRDIAIELGYLPEEMKEIMKCNYMIETGEPYFSLSDCSMGTARDFITFLMDFVLKEGIQLSDSGIERADDVGKYLYACIKHRKCAVCGKDTMLIQSAWEMTGGGWMILDTGKSVCAGRTTRSHINEECRASRKCITSTESLWMIARKGNHRVQHGTVNRVSQYGSKFYTSQKGGWLEPPERGRNADQQQTERETLRVGAFQKVPGVWLHGVPPDRAILREHRGRIRCCRPPGDPRGSETSRANAAL